MNQAQLSGIAAIIVASVLWGTTGTAATFARGLGPLAIAAAALGIGGLLQAAIAVPAIREAWPRLSTEPGLVLLGIGAVAAYPLAFYSSMHNAGVAIGTVISIASAPLAAGLIEWLMGERPQGRWALAVSLGVFGGILLCVSRPEGTASGGSAVLGIALGLVAGSTYAVYSWVARRLMTRGVSRAASMGTVFGGGGLLLMPILALTGGPLLTTTDTLLAAAYMALIPMFLGYVLFGFGLARVSASTALTTTLVEPTIATGLAVAIVGERLTATGWTGLSLVAASLLILVAKPRSEARTASSRRHPGGPGDCRPRAGS